MKFKEIMEQARSRISYMPGAFVDHGHVLPLGIFATEADYDVNVVKQLVRKGQLAPFYEGQNEPCRYEHNQLEYGTECPICFLFYPSKLNRTRCCDKSICTECFLQLRRSPRSLLATAVCPFCVQPNFGVLYIPPIWSKFYVTFKKKRPELLEGDKKHYNIGPEDSDVVLVDTVRPKWDEVSEEIKLSSVGTTRRRRVQLNNGLLDNQEASENNNSHTTDINLEDIIVMEAIRTSLSSSNNTTITTTNNTSDMNNNHS